MHVFGTDFWQVLYAIAILACVIIALVIWVMYKACHRYPVIHRAEEEYYFRSSNSTEKFPSLLDQWSIHLSVVVPAYNEEERLPPMLDECLNYLQERQSQSQKCGHSFLYEVIIVSDGSRDNTVAVAEQYSEKYGSNVVRVLNLLKNRGKGGAVRLGVLSARGAVILFADADGATKFADLSRLEAALKLSLDVDYLEDPDVVSSQDAIICGSRAHLEEDAVATRSAFRTFLMYGFQFLVRCFAVKNVKDTQCGFKLFTRQAARLCFQSLHVERWAFDAEILHIAQRLKLPVSEVAVNWTEIEGSKIVPVWSWLQMGRDLVLIWMKYQIGAWKIHHSKPE